MPLSQPPAALLFCTSSPSFQLVKMPSLSTIGDWPTTRRRTVLFWITLPRTQTLGVPPMRIASSQAAWPAWAASVKPSIVTYCLPEALMPNVPPEVDGHVDDGPG